MKKIILNLIAIVCISLMSFANTKEIIRPLNLELDATEAKSNINVNYDKAYWCVAYYTETTYNDFDGTYTTTTYYVCTEIVL